MATSEPVTDSLEPDGQDDIAGVPKGNISGAKWELLEALAVVILAAESLRIIGSVVAGTIYGLSTTVQPLGQQRLVGEAFESASNFSDGPGIVLLLFSLGFLWWRAEYWTSRIRQSVTTGTIGMDVREEGEQARRLRLLSRWAVILFGLASAGAIAYLVGNVLLNTQGGVSNTAKWMSFADDSFSFAYLVIALAGFIGSLRIIGQCDIALRLIRAPV